MELILLIVIAVLMIVLLVLSLTKGNNQTQAEQLQIALRQQMQENREELNRSIRELRMEMTQTLNQNMQQLQDVLHKNMMTTGELQRQKFDMMARQQEALLKSTEKRLDDMRLMVEEKLQKTLNERIGQSFEIVRSQLENVQKGLGEMKSLAQDVGGLKKVLSNVKMRGTFGEVQLGALLEQMMSPEQYDANVKTKKSGTEFVEFAIKLPGKDDANSTVYLPIDAKFPKDVYEQYYDAFEAGDAALMESSGKQLENTIKKMAKDIHDKYVDPPFTTDFAIMFLPFESIYAEVILSEEVSHLGEVPKAEAIHRLDQFARDALLAQKSGQDDRLVVRLGEDARGACMTVMEQFVDQRAVHDCRGVAGDANPSLFVAHRLDLRVLHPSGDRLDELVGKGDRMTGTAEIVGHLDEASSGSLGQLEHVAGVRPPEFVDVLVVVTHGDDAHLLVADHQRRYEGILVGGHVLCFVDDEHGLADLVGFDLPLFDHPGSPRDNILGIFEVTDTPQQVETIGVEGLDLDEMGRIADQRHQPLFELRGRRTREGEHQQLFVLDRSEEHTSELQSH